jgi:pilus assembly protein CpaC
VINNDSVEQTVRVKENETATLAGILEPQVTSAINGTPGLADLPVIGWLGKNQTTQTQDTELLIMITPRMMELTPHKNHVIYAGQGTSEGSEGGAPPVTRNGSSSYNGGGGQTSPSQGQPPSTAPQYAPNTPR